jgi:hypothetical protein
VCDPWQEGDTPGRRWTARSGYNPLPRGRTIHSSESDRRNDRRRFEWFYGSPPDPTAHVTYERSRFFSETLGNAATAREKLGVCNVWFESCNVGVSKSNVWFESCNGGVRKSNVWFANSMHMVCFLYAHGRRLKKVTLPPSWPFLAYDN